MDFSTRLMLSVILLDLALVFFLGKALYTRYDEYQRKARYLPASGKITRSSVEPLAHVGSDRSAPSYRVDIRYEYIVNGQKFFGNKVSWKSGASDQQGASRVARKYSNGSLATIYYNPTQPRESILDPAYTYHDLQIALILTALSAIISIAHRVFGRNDRSLFIT